MCSYLSVNIYIAYLKILDVDLSHCKSTSQADVCMRWLAQALQDLDLFVTLTIQQTYMAIQEKFTLSTTLHGNPTNILAL